MKRSRFFWEGIFIIILMILVMILMVNGTLSAQIPDSVIQSHPTNVTLPGLDHPYSPVGHTTRSVQSQHKTDLTGSKVFVLDESTMVEMMKQDEKIAILMTAAVVKAIGNDVKLCELIRWDLNEAMEVEGLHKSDSSIDSELKAATKWMKSENGKTATQKRQKCSCKCACCNGTAMND